jgi:hypothetical protein
VPAGKAPSYCTSIDEGMIYEYTEGGYAKDANAYITEYETAFNNDIVYYLIT